MATNKNITMRQFNGTDYDTLYPKTKVEQVEGAYTQQQILADSTKTMFGLGTDAVPDDAFKALSAAVVEDGKGLLLISAMDASGNHFGFVSVSVDGAIKTLNEFGFYAVSVDAGSYTISIANELFYSFNTTSMTVDVVAGKITPVVFFGTVKSSGVAKILYSADIMIPTSITSADLFVVGGGGSGGTTNGFSSSSTNFFNAAGGGAGGHTASVFNKNLSGKKLKCLIGAGGTASTNGSGNKGGSTSVSVGNEVICEAEGGEGGQANQPGSGGSGGGRFEKGDSTDASVVGGNGGSNGSDGDLAYGTYGRGQGTTTRAFGEPTGELYAGGGGGAGLYVKTSSSYNAKGGNGGAGGGGNGNAKKTGNVIANSGTNNTGSGGGGAVTTSEYTPQSGAGGSGIILIRW